MDRRTFIKLSVASSGGLLISVNSWANHAKSKIGTSLKPNFYLVIKPDGEVEFHLTKLEMGQCPGIGYRAMVADELDIDIDKVTMLQTQYNASTVDAYNHINGSTTGGSRSIRLGWQPIREAAATGRILMQKAAAKTWKIPETQCITENGIVINRANNQQLTYGELVPIAATLTVPKEVKLKTLDEYRYVGKKQQNYLSEDIVRGNLTYGIDLEIPNLHYAALNRAPQIDATVKSINSTKAEKYPGVVAIVHLPLESVSSKKADDNAIEEAGFREGVAVVATSSWAAFNAAKMLDITWESSLPEHNNQTLKNYCRDCLVKDEEVIFQLGNSQSEFDKQSNQFSMNFEVPYVTHHYMEPLNATAIVSDNECELWAGTQNPDRDASSISAVLEIPKSKMKVNVLPTGGSFGRKFNPDFTIEAALIAQKTKLPVKVTWTREDETRFGQQGDYEYQQYDAALDQHGQIKAYNWKTISSEGWGWGYNPYLAHVENQKLSMHVREKTLNLAPWRAVSLARSNGGMEGFVDELAYQQKQDPLEYRLAMLQQPMNLDSVNEDQQWVKGMYEDLRKRYAIMLSEVAKKADWDRSREKGRGLGIAAGHFSQTVVAQVADVSVSDGKCKINKITTLVDCGLVVNPNTAEQQVRGSTIWGLNTLFKPETHFENTAITQSNFHETPVLLMHEIPEMDIHFMESDKNPTGLGEPSVCAIIPAVLNAIRAASGTRIEKRRVDQYDYQA